MVMHMYYWEDPGQKGYDYVALADSETNARSKAISAYDGPPELKEAVLEGLEERPTGIFHYNSAIEIFTECDPEGSLAAHQEWDKLRDRISTLERELAEARAELAEVGEQLEFDRTKVAECITTANKAIDSRHWLTEGRGPYEWDDDRWHDEFRTAALEIKAALAPLTKIAADWQACPQTGTEVAKARIDLKAALAKKDEALRSAKAAIWDSYYGHGLWAAYARQISDEIDAALSAPAPQEGKPCSDCERKDAALREIERTAEAAPDPNPDNATRTEVLQDEAICSIARVAHDALSAPAPQQPTQCRRCQGLGYINPAPFKECKPCPDCAPQQPDRREAEQMRCDRCGLVQESSIHMTDAANAEIRLAAHEFTTGRRKAERRVIEAAKRLRLDAQGRFLSDAWREFCAALDALAGNR